MKVYIWGTGYLASKCLDDLIDGVEVLGFIETNPEINKQFKGISVISGAEAVKRDYDYIILANSFYKEIISEFFCDTDKVIVYPREVVEVEGKVRFERIYNNKVNPFVSEKAILSLNEARKTMPFVSFKMENLNFIFDSTDYLIPSEMLFRNEVYSKDEMIFFSKYIKEDEGLFFDIGANVGTTTVYFRKKLKPKMQYHAFEPLFDNHRCLSLNCRANDCEDVITVNKGLSNEDASINMSVFDGASGSSWICEEGSHIEKCDFISLDEYVSMNDINPRDIKAMWVDVQCHEYEVVKGALRTLVESDAVIFLEFNIEYQVNKGTHDELVLAIQNLYKTFICYEQYEKGMTSVRPISELGKLKNEMDISFCNVLLMK